MPGTKMMGYQKGGDVKKKKKAKKKPMKMMADDGGSMTGKMNPKRKKVLDAIKANNSKPTPSMMPTAKNNTMPPKPQAPAQAPTPPQAAMGAGAAMGAAAGGMGMPPKKPPMPGMKAGGKVKKKAKSYGHGGKVRGAGIAKKGVKKCKMR
jgi:hypothetical protein